MNEVTTETRGTIFTGEFDTLEGAVTALYGLLADYPHGFFTLQDRGKGDARTFTFSYFPEVAPEDAHRYAARDAA